MRYISGLKTLAKDFYYYNFSGVNELFSYDDTHEDNIEIFMKDNSFSGNTEGNMDVLG